MSDTPKELMLGDCLDRLKELPDNSVDAVVTDPPYGISFMAKKWDYDVPSVDVWTEAMRVLKPGGHALIACGTRTQHRMVCNIEDAGFEIRDVVSWVYGSGFPKSLNVGKAIDKMDASEAQLARRYKFTEWVRSQGVKSSDIDATTGTNMGGHYTTQASQPAIMTREHLEACRHLFADVPQWVEDECDKRSVESENFKSREVVGSKTGNNQADGGKGCFGVGVDMVSVEIDITAPATEAAKQWDGWGTALKPSQEFFTLCRKPLGEKTVAANVLKWGTGGINIDGSRVGAENGRFPANLIHDGSQEVLDLFPETKSGARKARTGPRGGKGFGMFDDEKSSQALGTWPADNGGSAARFFYCPKASKKDREEGNTHPTVKPTALMSYLCRLITPPGGVILDPYMGSGSTGKAARLEGFQFVGIEREPEFMAIAEARITNAI